MRRVATLLCVLSVALTLGAASLSRAEDVPPGRWWMNPDVQSRLGLTPDQVSRIGAVYNGRRAEMADLRVYAERRQRELDLLLAADPVDKAALTKKADDLADARAKLERDRLGTLAEVRAVLSADQYGRLRDMQRNFRCRRGPGGGGPPNR